MSAYAVGANAQSGNESPNRFETAVMKGKEVKIMADPVTGSAERIEGHGLNLTNYNWGRYIQVTDTSATKEAVLRMVADLDGLPSLTTEALKVDRYRHRDGVLLVRMAQEIDGIPIEGARFGLTADREGKVVSMGGQTYDLDNVTVRHATVGREAAEKVARALYEHEVEIKSAELVYQMNSSEKGKDARWEAVPAWKVEAKSVLHGILDHVHIDAQSGSITDREDQIRRLANNSDHLSEVAKVTSTSTDGILAGLYGTLTGTFYPTEATDSPTSVGIPASVRLYNNLGQPVGAFIANSSGSYSSPGLATGYYSPIVEMKNAIFTTAEKNGGSYELVSYVHGSYEYSGSPFNFSFSSESQATTAFKHANDFRDHFLAFPFSHDELVSQGVFIANDPAFDARSYGQDIEFGRLGGHYYAHSSDAVYHEMGHNLAYSLYGYLLSGQLGEGFADYGAAILNNDPDISEDVGVSRTLSNSLVWDGFETNEYTLGQIVGGAMWDLRGEIGSTADVLWFRAMEMEPQPTTFVSYLHKLYVADYLYNSMSARYDIEDAFAGKQITTDYPELEAMIYGPSAIPTGYYETWTAAPTFGNGSYSYAWSYRPYGTSTWYSMPFYTSTLYTTFTEDVDIRVVITSGSEQAEGFITVWVDDDCEFTICEGMDSEEMVEMESDIPKDFVLHGNYPNPFNPSTQIEFSLPKPEEVEVSVFDVAGRLISRSNLGTMAPGRHAYRWEAGSRSSGVYFFYLKAGSHTAFGRMSLVK